MALKRYGGAWSSCPNNWIGSADRGQHGRLSRSKRPMFQTPSLAGLAAQGVRPANACNVNSRCASASPLALQGAVRLSLLGIGIAPTNLNIRGVRVLRPMRGHGLRTGIRSVVPTNWRHSIFYRYPTVKTYRTSGVTCTASSGKGRRSQGIAVVPRGQTSHMESGLSRHVGTRGSRTPGVDQSFLWH